MHSLTVVEAGLGLGDVSQAGVRGALELVEPGQVLLLGLGPLLCLQGPLERQTLLLEGELQTPFLLWGHNRKGGSDGYWATG